MDIIIEEKVDNYKVIHKTPTLTKEDSDNVKKNILLKVYKLLSNHD